MEKKSNKLLIVVGVLLVIGVGITFAYFAVQARLSGDGANTEIHTASAGDTTITTEGSISFNDLNVYPGHQNISKLKITATGTREVGYNLIWSGTNTINTTLNYKVYKTTSDETPSITCEKKEEGALTKILYETCTNNNFDNLGSAISSGEISTTSETIKIILKENESIQATSEGAIVYYYVILEYPNKEESQNIDSNGRLNGETNIELTEKDPVITKDDIIASVNVKETAPDYTQAATTDEGVYKISDGMYGGYSYVWRGAVTNNWVKFANKYWRIIRINGDGTIRLIYSGEANENISDANKTGEGTQISNDNGTTTTYAYNTLSNRSEYVGYTYKEEYQRPSDTESGTETASTIKGIINSWYNSNIANNATYVSKVAEGKYCNDRDTASGYTWSSQPSSTFYYKGYDRIVNGKAPVLSCPEKDVYTLNAGLITADEVSMAGGLLGIGNTNYYLYTNQNNWTMSPSSWYATFSYADVFIVDSNGNFGFNSVDSTNGVRPVINLRADTEFQFGGLGTEESPYIVVE